MDSAYIVSTSIIAVYFAAVLYIGMFAAKRFPQTDMEQYVLGGRSTGWLLASLCLMATQYSAMTFLGFPAIMYASGLGPFVAIMAHYMFFAAFFWMLFCGRIWKIGRKCGHMTPSDTLEHYFESKALGYLVAAILFLAMIPYLQTQIMGVAYLMEVATGGLIRYTLGAVLTYLIIFLYVYYGGMKAIIYTDAMQGVLILFGILIGGLGMVFVAGGGWARTFAEAMANAPEKLVISGPGKAWDWSYIISWAWAVGMGFQILPHMWLRMHIPRTVQFLRYWPLIITVTFPIVMGSGFLVALVAMSSLAGYEEMADKIIILSYQKYFHPAMLGILAAAGLAAMMSTLSGQLHALGAMTVNDFAARISGTPIDPKRAVALTRGTVAVAATVGLILSFVNPQMLVILAGFSAAMGGQVTVVAICALSNWRWVTRYGAAAGIIGGVLAMFLTGLEGLAPWGVHPYNIYCGAWGLVVNMALLLGVSAFTQKGKTSDATYQMYKTIGW